MYVRWLNARDDRERFNRFASNLEWFGEILEDGQSINPNLDFSQDLLHPSMTFLGALDGEDLFAVFKLTRVGQVLFEVHIVLHPDVRNSIGLGLAKESLLLFWERWPACKLLAIIPASNRPALFFAYAAGFKPCGKIPESFFKRKQLWPRIMLEQ